MGDGYGVNRIELQNRLEVISWNEWKRIYRRKS